MKIVPVTAAGMLEIYLVNLWSMFESNIHIVLICFALLSQKNTGSRPKLPHRLLYHQYNPRSSNILLLLSPYLITFLFLVDTLPEILYCAFCMHQLLCCGLLLRSRHTIQIFVAAIASLIANYLDGWHID